MRTQFVFHGPTGAPLQLEFIGATYHVWYHILAAKPFMLKLIDGEVIASLQGGQLEVQDEFKPAIAFLDRFIEIERRAASSDMLAQLEKKFEESAKRNVGASVAVEGSDDGAALQPVTESSERELGETRAVRQEGGQGQSRPESHRRRR
ncbi:hypothetical protein APY03_0500 [Variovorax sp. WDL1]|nr:hypothetical protein APY03_0500 [Variovorax sp. WDL1]